MEEKGKKRRGLFVFLMVLMVAMLSALGVLTRHLYRLSVPDAPPPVVPAVSPAPPVQALPVAESVIEITAPPAPPETPLTATEEAPPPEESPVAPSTLTPATVPAGDFFCCPRLVSRRGWHRRLPYEPTVRADGVTFRFVQETDGPYEGRPGDCEHR